MAALGALTSLLKYENPQSAMVEKKSRFSKNYIFRNQKCILLINQLITRPVLYVVLHRRLIMNGDYVRDLATIGIPGVYLQATWGIWSHASSHYVGGGSLWAAELGFLFTRDVCRLPYYSSGWNIQLALRSCTCCCSGLVGCHKIVFVKESRLAKKPLPPGVS